MVLQGRQAVKILELWDEVENKTDRRGSGRASQKNGINAEMAKTCWGNK